MPVQKKKKNYVAAAEADFVIVKKCGGLSSFC